MGFTPSLLKKQMTERCSSLVHVASGAVNLTLLLRRRVAFLHSTATCRPLFKPSVSLFFSLQDNRAVFRIFIALLRSSFDCPSFIGYTFQSVAREVSRTFMRRRINTEVKERESSGGQPVFTCGTQRDTT